MQNETPESRIYIGSLHYELGEAEIRMAFSPFGEIKSVDMSYEPNTGKSKGYCFLGRMMYVSLLDAPKCELHMQL